MSQISPHTISIGTAVHKTQDSALPNTRAAIEENEGLEEL